MLMVLLLYYNIPSERELMAQLGERLDFLWFLGFDLETTIPDHSVLSKARARWGAEVFEQLAERSTLVTAEPTPVVSTKLALAGYCANKRATKAPTSVFIVELDVFILS